MGVVDRTAFSQHVVASWASLLIGFGKTGMKRFFALLSATFLVACNYSPSAQAQSVLDDAYGRGVHAYYAGQTDRALEWLDLAISSDSKDPRVYYYHGLATIRQAGGNIDAGLGDFETAADMEINSGRVVNVSAALERIQGSVRHQIEDIRLRTKVANKDRLPSVPMTPVVPREMGRDADPFVGGSSMTGGEPEVMTPKPRPTTPAPATGSDPFGASSEPATTPPSDPFGTSPAPAAGDDPFGSTSPSPFGGDAASDPFGDDSGSPFSN